MSLNEQDYCVLARDIVDECYPYGGEGTASIERSDERLEIDYGLYVDYGGQDEDTGERIFSSPELSIFDVRCYNIEDNTEAEDDFDEDVLEDEVLRLIY
jgi:hypothetical protein